MLFPRHSGLLLALLLLLSATPSRAQADLADLFVSQASLASPTSELHPAHKRLIADAELALQQKPLSVLDKKKGLDGVDPHDYVSYAPYFWPNPDTLSGLPFIRKDGKRNREQVALGDEDNAGAIKRAITTLGLAYRFDTHVVS